MGTKWCLGIFVVVVVVGTFGVNGNPKPLSPQQQLRRRGVSRGRDVTVSSTEPPQVPETTEAVVAVETRETPQYGSINRGGKRTRSEVKPPEAAVKSVKEIKEDELDTIRAAFYEREKVLEEREFALDTRDADLDDRIHAIDKQVLDTDKRLKEREDRIGVREHKLNEREIEILKLAEAREKEINRMTLERENAAEIREKALEDREKALEEREKRVEDRETRVNKRMEANRKRFQRRRELQQLDQRIGVANYANPSGIKAAVEKVLQQQDISTGATTNLPKRSIVETVTLRKAVPSETQTIITSSSTVSEGPTSTTSLTPDEHVQVTEAAQYESAKDYSTTTVIAPVKGEPAAENSVGVTKSKRKGSKRRARQRRQGHEHHRKHKVRKVVKKRNSEGIYVVMNESQQ